MGRDVVGADHVVGLVGRIGADDEEVRAGVDPLVARSGGQDRDVARLQPQRLAGLAAESNLRPAMGDAKRLVAGRMVVVEGIDAVAPEAAPAIGREQRLDRRRAVAAGRRL
ncbi:hypothetical protein [Chenggangzhangella methanolivorans]|uniref:Uncharacterized protein n=1 Tax=Chenggangzhangella methanolivorans TaxID=1437009 RepID=A0A9E6RCT5_9HYPH|nr:hypothetical protein [Chenggangzhangella methanolivorans]QZO00883.1 hypothetical protein K6K41_04370 [Chenggangzhangella methanolivorans]